MNRKKVKEGKDGKEGGQTPPTESNPTRQHYQQALPKGK